MTATATSPEADCLSRQPAGDQDDLLRTAAAGVLRSSGYRPLGGLHCEASGGTVTVSGVVPSFYLKQMAQAALLRLPTIRRVNNLVQVSQGLPGAAARP